MDNTSTELTLGLDLSTQSLKLVALDTSLNVVFRSQVNFDADLPHYKTTMGAHFKPNNQVTSPVLMFIEALDLILSKMKSQNFPFCRVVAISGSGQQHGSVYWTSKGKDVLEKLDQSQSLLEQFSHDKPFSLEDAPIWMDNSTTANCRELEAFLKGPAILAQKTGSVAYERFTGNQIAKIYRENPEAYKETVHISLISSFLAELFLGKFSHIDYSDGCGMNLLNLETKQWDAEIANFIGPNLLEKLYPPCPSHTLLGKISAYHVGKYGFSAETSIIACSGDNPNSLVGLGVFDTNDVCISLGTSDTIFGLAPVTQEAKSLEGHIFISPVDPELYFVMICTKNGSSVREKIKREYASNSWETYESLLKRTVPGNKGNLCLIYEYPEIVPYIETPDVKFLFDKDGNQVDKMEEEYIVRGAIEGKIVALKYHAEKKGLIASENGKIYITGGGSKNKDILQIIANVFQKEVTTLQVEDSASLGAAIRAFHGYYCAMENKMLQFKDIFKSYASQKDQNQNVIKPEIEYKAEYEHLTKLYEKVLPKISSTAK